MGEDEFLAAVAPHREVMAMLAARLAPAAAPGTVLRAASALAWRHRAGFDPGRGSWRSWLLAITADCAEAARPRRGRADVSRADVRGGEGDDSLERSALDVAVAALPVRQRFVVDCVHFVGLAAPETAGLMRMSERSVGSVLTDAQRRIGAALDADGEPVEELLQSAGATWRDDFRRAPLPELLKTDAATDIPAVTEVYEQSVDAPAEAPESPANESGTAEPASGPDPASRPRRKRAWLLPTVIGVVVLIVAGTLAVITAVKAAEIAALEQQDRDLQLCGQVAPGLDGITVTRVGRSFGDHFEVQSVAKASTSVYAAQVTGVDATGKIATYLKRDVVTQKYTVIAVVQSAGQPTTTRTTLAHDRCDGMTPGTEGLTDHLILYAFADSGRLVMDAGPIDQLDVTGR